MPRYAPSGKTELSPDTVVTENGHPAAGDFSTLGKNSVHNVSGKSKFREAAQKIKRMVDRYFSGSSLSGRGRESFEDYLPVSDRPVEDARTFGLDIEGYKHCIIDQDVAHAYSKQRNVEGPNRADRARFLAAS